MVAGIRLNARTTVILFTLAILLPIGFATKFYSGPGQVWVSDSLGGVFYVIFWCLAGSLFFPNLEPWKIACVVLVVTSGLEILQLVKHPVLDLIRQQFLGRALIGTSFAWSDFFYYFVGCALGLSGLLRLRNL